MPLVVDILPLVVAEEDLPEPMEETQRREWLRDTVWEKEHLIDGEGLEPPEWWKKLLDEKRTV